MPEANASQDRNALEATRVMEKLPLQASNGRFGDQVSSEMLKELAPNGEDDYILDKINNMTEEEAVAIIQESRECDFHIPVVDSNRLPVKFHSDDWNFPSDMRARMQRLMEGPKLYGDFYDRDLRIDATILRYSSPYPGVRSVAELVDDPSVPAETIRAYFLGITWAVIGTFMSTFFNSRFPGISKDDAHESGRANQIEVSADQ
jgi:hypothetical protein